MGGPHHEVCRPLVKPGDCARPEPLVIPASLDRPLINRSHKSTLRVEEYEVYWPGWDNPTHTEARNAKLLAQSPQIQCHPIDGSTHELVFDREGFLWLSGQAYDHVARIGKDGLAEFFKMPCNSAPHGLVIDQDNHLWVTLQGSGELWRYYIAHGSWDLVEKVDVKMKVHRYGGDHQVINIQPHGLGLGKDGSLWFTNKQTSTVGRLSPKCACKECTCGCDNWKLTRYPLETTNAVPIYVAADHDGNMWCTQLYGNAIARITPKDVIKEFPITTTPNSRPITITKPPIESDKSMWFTEEAGGHIGRIDKDGKITEFRVPLAERDALLAALTFDRWGNIWVQQYVMPPILGSKHTAHDYIVKLGSELYKATLDEDFVRDPPTHGDITDVGVTFYKVPTQGTVMHRIVEAPDEAGTIWFTELGSNRIGCIGPNNNQELGTHCGPHETDLDVANTCHGAHPPPHQCIPGVNIVVPHHGPDQDVPHTCPGAPPPPHQCKPVSIIVVPNHGPDQDVPHTCPGAPPPPHQCVPVSIHVVPNHGPDQGVPNTWPGAYPWPHQCVPVSNIVVPNHGPDQDVPDTCHDPPPDQCVPVSNIVVPDHGPDQDVPDTCPGAHPPPQQCLPVSNIVVPYHSFKSAAA